MVILCTKKKSSGVLLRIIQGDLTEEHSDAIVNAANQHLQLGEGVAGAIRKKGGAGIQEQCDAIGAIPAGRAVATTAGTLSNKYVIHAVGPVWQGGNQQEDDLLASAIRSALQIANELHLESISFPAISSGIFGFPKSRCVEIMLSAIDKFLVNENTSLTEVRCTNIDSATANIFYKEFKKRFGD